MNEMLLHARTEPGRAGVPRHDDVETSAGDFDPFSFRGFGVPGVDLNKGIYVGGIAGASVRSPAGKNVVYNMGLRISCHVVVFCSDSAVAITPYEVSCFR